MLANSIFSVSTYILGIKWIFLKSLRSSGMVESTPISMTFIHIAHPVQLPKFLRLLTLSRLLFMIFCRANQSIFPCWYHASDNLKPTSILINRICVHLLVRVYNFVVVSLIKRRTSAFLTYFYLTCKFNIPNWI